MVQLARQISLEISAKAVDLSAEFGFSQEYFQRVDESVDSEFYAMPRMVVHIDDQAIAAVGRLFRGLIPPNSVVLDLMSSWRSHWPQGHPKARMTGLGLNAAEMADNPDLDEYLVHDLNLDPVLPLEDESFDAVVVTVSVQYMIQPVETFRQVERILRPGGVFIVTFSNRMFPTKAVRIWRESSDKGRADLISTYMEAAGNFTEIKAGFVNPQDSPPSDPLFAVTCKKAGGPA